MSKAEFLKILKCVRVLNGVVLRMQHRHGTFEERELLEKVEKELEILESDITKIEYEGK